VQRHAVLQQRADGEREAGRIGQREGDAGDPPVAEREQAGGDEDAGNLAAAAAGIAVGDGAEGAAP